MVFFQPPLIAAVKEFGQIINIEFANLYIYILEMSWYIHPLWKPGPIENCCDLCNWKIVMDRKQFLSVTWVQDKISDQTQTDLGAALYLDSYFV